MINAVLFDLDGTLLDRESSVDLFLDRQYVRLHPWLKSIKKPDFIRRFKLLEKRGYVWKDVVYTQLIEGFQLTGCTTDILLQDYLDHFQESCVPFCDLHKTLQALKANGLKIGMVTNGRKLMQTRSIQGLGIEPFFDVIAISEVEGCSKPDPDIFNQTLSRLGVSAKESIFVGDHAINDIDAAQQVGMKAVWKQNDSDEPKNADAQIDQLMELLTLVDQWNKTSSNNLK